MFNVTVLRMRDLFKYFIVITLIILSIGMLAKGIKQGGQTDENNQDINLIKNIKNKLSSLLENNIIPYIEQTIPAMGSVNQEYKKQAKEKKETQNILHSILDTQISSIKGMNESAKINDENDVKLANANENNKKEISENSKVTEEASKQVEGGTKTEVITKNPISENSNTQYGKVKIKNQTEYALTEEMMKPDIEISNKNIVLFHTHSCESYTSSEKYPYTPTGNFRTTDLNYTVTRVGTELETELKKYNYNVVHNTDYHDYPSYNGSYTKSLSTVENILKTTPSDIIIDVHRDAIGSRSDYAPTVKIGEGENAEEAAQLMFVVRNK